MLAAVVWLYLALASKKSLQICISQSEKSPKDVRIGLE